MTVLTSRVVLEYIGPDLPDDELDDLEQVAIDIVDDVLEHAKTLIAHSIRINPELAKKFEVSVL